MLGEIFYWIFNMSIAATICAIPVLLLRLFKKIPRRIFIWLWLVPFVRMCIPVGISSKYGIMALLSKFTTKTVTIVQIGDDSALTMMNHVMGANSYFPITYKVNLLEDLFNIASVIWLIVALAAILTMTVIYFITLGEMKDAKKLKDNIYISDKIKTPAVYGIINPKIILPTEYDAKRLDFILMHEKAHIKRKDNFIRLLALIVVCVHWFNPFAWLLLKMLYSDIELACDETVLSKCNETERKEYAYTLISTAEKTKKTGGNFRRSFLIRSLQSHRCTALRAETAVALIAADGTNVDFGAKHIPGNIPICDRLAAHQFHHRNPQRPGERIHQCDIRQSLGSLPLGHRLVADADQAGKLRLGQSALFTQAPDRRARNISIHTKHLTSPSAYHSTNAGATYAA